MQRDLIWIKVGSPKQADFPSCSNQKRLKMKRSLLAATALVALTCAAPAFAQSKGDFTLGLGFASVNPKSDNGSLVGGTLPLNVGSNVRPTITFEYFLKDNLGIEVLAATPFKHNINLTGLGDVGSVKHLPPVVSVQYHFPTGGPLTPFVGAGINYTAFFSEKATGALAGSQLRLDDSWGLALHLGVDYKLSEKGSLRADVRWADIDSDVKLNDTKIGTAEIDPLVVGVSYVMNF